MSGQAIVSIRDKQWQAYLATTYAELTTGLRGQPSIPPGTGVLFVLPGDQAVTVTTQGMLFAIDIVFVTSQLQVAEVAMRVSPDLLVAESTPVRYFLEINTGEAEGIESGDMVTISIVQPATADWMSPIVSLASVVMVGGMLVSIVRTVTNAVFAKPKERPVLYGPRGEQLLPQTTGRYFKPGEIVMYQGEKVRVSEQIGDRVNIFIPSRQELVWVKPDKLEKIEPASSRDKQVILSALIIEELNSAGWGFVAQDIARAVEKRCQFSDWLELYDGTTFERKTPYRGSGLRVSSRIAAEIGIQTRLKYNEQIAISKRIDEKLKEADTIVLGIDGTIFRKSFVPVKRTPAVVSDKESLAVQILEGLSAKDGYRAYVKYPKDKSAFVTIGAIIGGHYSWNPAGFTVYVDSWERNPEWPPDHILAIKELRRPRTFEATEEGVKKALEYVETEFPTFTETMWVSKSIPIYVAHELGIMKKEAAPEWLPGVVVMPKIPEEARKDVLFVEYIHDLVKLGERVSDEEAKRMWEAWKKKELSTEPLQNTREYVEIMAPGGTSLTIGSIITREELEKENKKARERGKQPATARIWQGGKPVLVQPKLVPTEPVPTKGELEFLPDSPEFLAYTIDDIGYREKIDSAFQEAIARVQGG